MPVVHIVSHTHDVYLFKSKPPVMKGGLYVRNMNRWDKQHVAGWARTNISGRGHVQALGGFTVV
jgi:hypothetical protein